jgi:predicted RNA-binding protein with PIN domain
MPIIVDGHNLIPRIPGLSLSDLDDEIKLIQVLQEYCRLRRVEIECYFDKAPQGHPRIQRFGQVKAIFARPGKIADDEIKERMVRLERKAKEWQVVSSDMSIQTAARAAKARIISSEDFSREIDRVFSQGTTAHKPTSEGEMSAEELEMWLKAFGADRSGK